MEDPCKKCGSMERTSQGAYSRCAVCARAWSKAYREANKEKLRARHRIYRKANKEKVRARHRIYRKANPEKLRAFQKARYAANPEKYRAKQKAWREADPEKCRVYRCKRLYGIDVMKELERCRHLCEICGDTITIKSHVDHDHNSGVFRGMLCPHCNRMLGAAKDSPETLRKAAMYLELKCSQKDVA